MKINKDLIQFYTQQLSDALIQKNHDYGNSVQEQFEEYGLTSILIRLDDKIRRLKTLSTHNPQVVEESLQDTLKDLAGYALLGQICVAHEKQEETVKIGQLTIPKKFLANFEGKVEGIPILPKPPYADLDD